MAELKRDQNYKTVAGAIESTGTNPVTPLYIDPVTDELMIEVVTTSASAPVASSNIGKRDQNYKPMVAAVTDDADLTFEALRCDSNGYLLIDLA